MRQRLFKKVCEGHIENIRAKSNICDKLNLCEHITLKTHEKN